MAKRYSDDELKTLLQLVAEHPGNFKEAFRLHAAETGRTIAGVAYKFNAYRKQNEAKVCMAIVSKAKSIPNRKNVTTQTTEIPVSKSLWQRILNLFKHND